MKDKDIRLNAEHPVAGMKHIVRGIARRGLRPIPPKASISLRVDADVLEWFKAQGVGVSNPHEWRCCGHSKKPRVNKPSPLNAYTVTEYHRSHP